MDTLLCWSGAFLVENVLYAGRVHVTICNTALLSQRRRELHSLSHLAKQTMTCLSGG